MKNLFLLLFLLPALAFGQDSISYVPMKTNPRPVVVDQPLVLKLAPLGLFDIDPTVQAAIEIPLRPKWSVQQEVGYGWQSLDPLRRKDWDWFYLAVPKSTFRARTEVRYYFSPDLLRRYKAKVGSNGFYAAGELLFKQLNHKRPGFTIKSIPSTGPLSPQTQFTPGTTRVTRNVYGIQAKIGYQTNLSKSGKNPQFIVDVYMGVGFRIISVRQTNGPELRATDQEDLDQTRFEPFQGTIRKPSVSGGVKIGWMINTGKKVKKK